MTTIRFRLLWATLLCAGLGVGGCSKLVYKIDIQQGNVVTQNMLQKVKTGMDKQQVGFILGTPLVVDVFNQDRWDYLYTFKPGRGERDQRNISLYFEEDRLVRIDGKDGSALGPALALEASETVVTVPPGEYADGLFAKVAQFFRRGEPGQDAAYGQSDPGSEPAGKSDIDLERSDGGLE